MIERRQLLRQMGAGLAGGLIAHGALADAAAPASKPASGSAETQAPYEVGSGPVGTLRDLPTRKLGRVGIDLPPLSFGTAAMGHAFYPAEPFEQVINAAIDAGVRYMDTARIYDVAEERLKPILAKRRN